MIDQEPMGLLSKFVLHIVTDLNSLSLKANHWKWVYIYSKYVWNPRVEESTWKLESDMLDKYPRLFSKIRFWGQNLFKGEGYNDSCISVLFKYVIMELLNKQNMCIASVSYVLFYYYVCVIFDVLELSS